MKPYPLTFEPILKPKVWGGRRLERYGKQLPDEQSIGESWELADLPASISDGRSIIANGPLAGQALRSVINADADRTIMGRAQLTPDGGFPVLLKYLDARENLSVQVHPDARYAAAHPDAHLKSEAWYIVEAEPGSVIYKGISATVTRRDFAAHIRTGEVVGDLLAVDACAGDCHYLPSGTCHALGAGVLVAEIQTPSDTTFRVFDWGRRDRELHVEQALDCIQFGEVDPPTPADPPIRAGVFETRDLCTTPFFRIEEIRVLDAGSLEIVGNGSPVVWMIINGSATIESDHSTLAATQGTTILNPARLDGARGVFERPSRFLQITLPLDVQDLIA